MVLSIRSESKEYRSPGSKRHKSKTMVSCLAQMPCKDRNLKFIWVWCIPNLSRTISKWLWTLCSLTNATLTSFSLNNSGIYRNAQVVIIPPRRILCLTRKTRNKLMTCFFLILKLQIYLNHKVHYLALMMSTLQGSKRRKLI